MDRLASATRCTQSGGETPAQSTSLWRSVHQTVSMRKQYHFWPADEGFDAWDVDRLVELSRGLPVESVAIDSIDEVDTSYWFDGSAEEPTVRKVVEHMRLILEVDPSYPILLGHDGRVMDGMHRIARALMEGRTEIDAVRFPAPLEPDYRGCQPHELPY
jgi:hypothetical protein